MKIQTVDDARELLERWFLKPVAMLHDKLSNGDGAIAALMIVLPLYERYINYIRIKGGRKADNDQLIADELGITKNQAKTFWTVFRHGFCHQSMPMAQQDGSPLPKVGMRHDYPRFPRFTKDEKGNDAIILDPWKFINFILDKYDNNPELLKSNKSFPLLPIYELIE